MTIHNFLDPFSLAASSIVDIPFGYTSPEPTTPGPTTEPPCPDQGSSEQDVVDAGYPAKPDVKPAPVDGWTWTGPPACDWEGTPSCPERTFCYFADEITPPVDVEVVKNGDVCELVAGGETIWTSDPVGPELYGNGDYAAAVASLEASLDQAVSDWNVTNTPTGEGAGPPVKQVKSGNDCKCNCTIKFAAALDDGGLLYDEPKPGDPGRYKFELVRTGDKWCAVQCNWSFHRRITATDQRQTAVLDGSECTYTANGKKWKHKKNNVKPDVDVDPDFDANTYRVKATFDRGEVKTDAGDLKINQENLEGNKDCWCVRETGTIFKQYYWKYLCGAGSDIADLDKESFEIILKDGELQPKEGRDGYAGEVTVDDKPIIVEIVNTAGDFYKNDGDFAFKDEWGGK